jgi:hypothetical protein
MYPSLFARDRSAEPEMQCRERSLDGELRPVLGEKGIGMPFSYARRCARPKNLDAPTVALHSHRPTGLGWSSTKRVSLIDTHCHTRL